MNDVSNRAVREFSEFLNSIEADFPKPTCTTAYEITMKSTIVSALITLDTEKQMDERFWNHLQPKEIFSIPFLMNINSNIAAIKAMQIIVPKTETMAILVVSFNPKILNSILVPPIEQIYNTTFIKNY